MSRTYFALSKLKTFESRFEYLKLDSKVGAATFGIDRDQNQGFYKSSDWKRIRDIVILRDNGCDLGISGRQINRKILVHHINPISLIDLEQGNPSLLDLNNLISTSESTHNGIHYGDMRLLRLTIKERMPGDTNLW